MSSRFSMLLALAALAGGIAALPAQAETILGDGISTADVPLTTGQPDRGAGAYRFLACDPAVAW